MLLKKEIVDGKVRSITTCDDDDNIIKFETDSGWKCICTYIQKNGKKLLDEIIYANRKHREGVKCYYDYNNRLEKITHFSEDRETVIEERTYSEPHYGKVLCTVKNLSSEYLSYKELIDLDGNILSRQYIGSKENYKYTNSKEGKRLCQIIIYYSSGGIMKTDFYYDNNGRLEKKIITLDDNVIKTVNTEYEEI